MQRVVRAAVEILAIACLAAQLPAQISVSLNESQSYPAARIGLNQGEQNFYGDFQLKNILSINPGFEAQAKDVVQNVAAPGTATSFSSNNPWDQVPNGFFNGGTFFVAYGANQGCTGRIASNTAADQGKHGPEFTLANACPHTFQRGDVIFTRVELFPTTADGFNFNAFGWAPSVGAGGVARLDANPRDQAPDSAGRQCVLLDTTATPVATAGVRAYFDTGDQLYYNFRGTYTESIKAKVVSGSGLRLTFSGYRLNASHEGAQWTQSVPLEGSWKTYFIRFFGMETPVTEAGPVQMQISLSGQGQVLIDDVSLTANDDANPTVFRDQVIKDEKLWDPGEGRYWAGQNAETLDDWIKPQFGREGMTGNTGSYRLGPQIQYGLHDWLTKEAYEGVSQVWIEMPVTWRDKPDAWNMVDYIAGDANSAYGAKRIALGQKAPWSSVFRRVVLEYGNEVWNAAAPGENILPYTENGQPRWPYLEIAIRFCSAMKANPAWNKSTMKCAAGLQTGGSFWTRQLMSMDKTHAIDLQANNEYGQFSPTQFSGASQWISAWTEAWAAANDPASGFYKTFHSGLQSGIYEFNNSTGYQTTITQAEADGYPEGEGYGLVDILMPLFDQKAFGIVDSDFFTLTQRVRGMRNLAGQSIKLHEWGAVVALGGKNTNPRPMALAAGMVNGCIGNGEGYNAMAADGPSYDFSGYNGVGPEKNVPYLNFFAFKNGNTRCIVAVNIDPAKSYTFSFTGNNPPSGAVEMKLYSSPKLTDNNESAMVVRIKSSSAQDPHSFEIPPHSAMTISYTVLRNLSMPLFRPQAVRAAAASPSGAREEAANGGQGLALKNGN